MPMSRLSTYLELSINGAARAASIMRRHSCAWHALSASQARSSGSSSRPSAVINRSPRKEELAQGPVRSIPWCGIVVLSRRMDRGNCFDSWEGFGMARHERGGPLRSACMRATQIAHDGDIQSDGQLPSFASSCRCSGQSHHDRPM